MGIEPTWDSPHCPTPDLKSETVLFGVFQGVLGYLMILLKSQKKAGEQFLPFSFLLWDV